MKRKIETSLVEFDDYLLQTLLEGIYEEKYGVHLLKDERFAGLKIISLPVGDVRKFANSLNEVEKGVFLADMGWTALAGSNLTNLFNFSFFEYELDGVVLGFPGKSPWIRKMESFNFDSYNARFEFSNKNFLIDTIEKYRKKNHDGVEYSLVFNKTMVNLFLHILKENNLALYGGFKYLHVDGISQTLSFTASAQYVYSGDGNSIRIPSMISDLKPSLPDLYAPCFRVNNKNPRERYFKLQECVEVNLNALMGLEDQEKDSDNLKIQSGFNLMQGRMLKNGDLLLATSGHNLYLKPTNKISSPEMRERELKEIMIAYYTKSMNPSLKEVKVVASEPVGFAEKLKSGVSSFFKREENWTEIFYNSLQDLLYNSHNKKSAYQASVDRGDLNSWCRLLANNAYEQEGKSYSSVSHLPSAFSNIGIYSFAENSRSFLISDFYNIVLSKNAPDIRKDVLDVFMEKLFSPLVIGSMGHDKDEAEYEAYGHLNNSSLKYVVEKFLFKASPKNKLNFALMSIDRDLFDVNKKDDKDFLDKMSEELIKNFGKNVFLLNMREFFKDDEQGFNRGLNYLGLDLNANNLNVHVPTQYMLINYNDVTNFNEVMGNNATEILPKSIMSMLRTHQEAIANICADICGSERYFLSHTKCEKMTLFSLWEDIKNKDFSLFEIKEDFFIALPGAKDEQKIQLLEKHIDKITSDVWTSIAKLRNDELKDRKAIVRDSRDYAQVYVRKDLLDRHLNSLIGGADEEPSHCDETSGIGFKL